MHINRFICWLSLCVACILAQPIAAQNATAAGVFSRTSAEAGDSIGLRIVVSGTAAKPAEVDFSAWSYFLSEEDIIRRTPWQQSSGKWVSDYTLIIMDSVNGEVPALPVRLLSGDSAMTNPIQLVVLPIRVNGDLDEMEPIRGIHPEELLWSDFALMALLVALVTGIVLGIWRWKMRPKKRPIVQQQPVQQEIPIAAEPPTPAHAKALQELERLSREKPWQKGNIKEYYAELSLIVRNYLEERYQIAAPESTTREIEAMLRQTGFPKERVADLRKILDQSDLAKYAQDLGTDKPHEQYLLRSEELIKQTAQ